jgi:hypothetical protein
MAWFDLADLAAKGVRGVGSAACAPLLAGYGLQPAPAQQLTRFAERHKGTSHLRRRLRLEFLMRARWIALRGRREAQAYSLRRQRPRAKLQSSQAARAR